jgi:hypothetical protein
MPASGAETTIRLAVSGGQVVLEEFRRVGDAADRELKRVGDAGSGAGRGLDDAATGAEGMDRRGRAAFTNVSNQIQDFVVQVEGGQGVLRALGQQGPQAIEALAMAFPRLAVAAGGLATGVAAAPLLVSALSGVVSSVRDYGAEAEQQQKKTEALFKSFDVSAESASRLTASMAGLTAGQKALAGAGVAAEVDAQAKSVDQLNKQLDAFIARRTAFTQATPSLVTGEVGGRPDTSGGVVGSGAREPSLLTGEVGGVPADALPKQMADLAQTAQAAAPALDEVSRLAGEVKAKFAAYQADPATFHQLRESILELASSQGVGDEAARKQALEFVHLLDNTEAARKQLELFNAQQTLIADPTNTAARAILNQARAASEAAAALERYDLAGKRASVQQAADDIRKSGRPDAGQIAQDYVTGQNAALAAEQRQLQQQRDRQRLQDQGRSEAEAQRMVALAGSAAPVGDQRVQLTQKLKDLQADYNAGIQIEGGYKQRVADITGQIAKLDQQRADSVRSAREALLAQEGPTAALLAGEEKVAAARKPNAQGDVYLRNQAEAAQALSGYYRKYADQVAQEAAQHAAGLTEQERIQAEITALERAEVTHGEARVELEAKVVELRNQAAALQDRAVQQAQAANAQVEAGLGKDRARLALLQSRGTGDAQAAIDAAREAAGAAVQPLTEDQRKALGDAAEGIEAVRDSLRDEKVAAADATARWNLHEQAVKGLKTPADDYREAVARLDGELKTHSITQAEYNELLGREKDRLEQATLAEQKRQRQLEINKRLATGEPGSGEPLPRQIAAGAEAGGLEIMERYGNAARLTAAEVGNLFEQGTSELVDYLSGADVDAKAFFASIAKELAALAIRYAIVTGAAQLFQAVSGGGGGANAAQGAIVQSGDIMAAYTPSARGNVFGRGEVVPFAFGGGVVDRPTLFPMAGGRRGLMGEAGLEVILPAERDASGRVALPLPAGGDGRRRLVPLGRDASGRLGLAPPERDRDVTPFALGGMLGGGPAYAPPPAFATTPAAYPPDPGSAGPAGATVVRVDHRPTYVINGTGLTPDQLQGVLDAASAKSHAELMRHFRNRPDDRRKLAS